MFLGSEFDPVFGLVWVRPSRFKMFFGLEVDSGFGLVQIRPSGSKIWSGHRWGWPKTQVRPNKNTFKINPNEP